MTGGLERVRLSSRTSEDGLNYMWIPPIESRRGSISRFTANDLRGQSTAPAGSIGRDALCGGADSAAYPLRCRFAPSIDPSFSSTSTRTYTCLPPTEHSCPMGALSRCRLCREVCLARGLSPCGAGVSGQLTRRNRQLAALPAPECEHALFQRQDGAGHDPLLISCTFVSIFTQGDPHEKTHLCLH